MKRMMAVTLVTLFAVLGGAVVPAMAESEKKDGLPFTGQWAIGAGVGFETSPYKDMDDEVTPMPLIFYKGDRLFIKGLTLGVELFEWAPGNARVSLAAIGGYDGAGYDASDSDFLTGMEDRDGTFEAGGALEFEMGIFTSELEFTTDVAGEHDGSQVDFSVGLGFDITERWHVAPSVGVEWLSSDKANHYYGVKAHEATAVRSAYEPGSALNLKAEIGSRYRLNENWILMGKVGVTQLDGDIEDSPIVDEDLLMDGFLGIQYRF